MEILLFIIGVIVFVCLLGSFVEHQDKAKEEQRQKGITGNARVAMYNKHFLEQREFHDGWAVVKLADYRYAYINKSNRFLNDEIFVSADDFKNGTAIVREYDKGVAIINANGTFVLPYDTNPKVETYIKPLVDGIYEYTKTYYTKPGYVERTDVYVIKQSGDFITKQPVSKVLEVKANFIKYQVGKLIGEIDFEGNTISRPFQKKERLGKGLYKVMQEKYAWGVYDESLDKIIIPCKYSDIEYSESMDLFIVRPYGDGKRGFPPYVVNRNNRVVISQLYERLSFFGNKYFEIGVSNNQSVYGVSKGIVDSTGKVLVKPLYRYIWVSDNGNFIVTKDDKRLGIVNNGISDLEYSSYEGVYTEKSTLYFVILKGNKYGTIDLDNNDILPIIYDSIKIIYKEKGVPFGYVVEKNRKYGVLDLFGNTIIPLIYTDIIQHNQYEDYKDKVYDWLYDDYSDDMDEDEWCIGDNFYKKTSYFEVVDENESIRYVDLEGKAYKKNYIQTTKSVSVKNNRYKPVTSNKKEKEKLLFFDTETTGLPSDYNAPINNSHNWPRLVQISWILTDENANIISQKNFIIKPNGFVISKTSSDIHRITTEKAVKEGLDLSIVLDLFDSDLKQADIIIGHNIDFDIKVVRAEMYRLKRTDNLVGKNTICTMKSTTDFCKIQGKYGYKYPKLQELYIKLFGHGFEEAHDSQADIFATMQCYFELCKRDIL